MSHIEEINRVVERAKRERASYIGSAVQAYAVPVVLVAGLSLMLLQFSSKPPMPPTEGALPCVDGITLRVGADDVGGARLCRGSSGRHHILA